MSSKHQLKYLKNKQALSCIKLIIATVFSKKRKAEIVNLVEKYYNDEPLTVGFDILNDLNRGYDDHISIKADDCNIKVTYVNRNPKTLEEIGTELGLTRERVRQIKEKAVRRLKQTARSKILKSYLGQ